MAESFLTNLQERSRAFAARSAASRAAGVERANYEGGRGFRAFTITDEGELEPTSSGYGFSRFWRGRPELGAGNPVDYDWRTLDRPAIEEGSGPIAPFGGRAARRFGERQQRRYEELHGGETENEAQLPQGGYGATAAAADPYGGSPVASGSEHQLTNVRETPRAGAERPGTQFSPERLGVGGPRLPRSFIEATVRDQRPSVRF